MGTSWCEQALRWYPQDLGFASYPRRLRTPGVALVLGTRTIRHGAQIGGAFTK
jgi:hypothetical protein